MQPCNLRGRGATMDATATQPTGLKALSIAILERNRQRNQDATITKSNATFPPPIYHQKLHDGITVTLPLLGEHVKAPRQDQPPEKEAPPLARPAETVTRAGIVFATPPRCYACKSTDLWLSRYGVTTCRQCHPPAPGAEAVTRIRHDQATT